jgi:hypothetical protein
VTPVVGHASRAAKPAPPRRLADAVGRCGRQVEMALARPRLLVALLVVYVPFFVVYFASPVAFSLPHAASACGGQPVLDQRWGYSAERVADYLQRCDVAGRAAITAQQDADLAYPALFAAVLTVAFALLLLAVRLPERHWAHALVLLPMISAAADYLENIGIRVLLAAYPRQPSIVPAMSAVTTVKLATGWACIGVLVTLAAAATIRRLRTVTRQAAKTSVTSGGQAPRDRSSLSGSGSKPAAL